MKTKYLVIFIYTFVLGFIGCAINQQTDSTFIKPSDLTKVNSTWGEISLPFEAQILAENNEGIIVLGEKGEFAKIGTDKKVQRFPYIDKIDSFTSKNGGLSLEKDNINKLETDSLCLPEKADLLLNKLFIFSRCDHLRQISTVDIGSNEPSLNLLTFIYPKNVDRDSDISRVVPYRPTDLVKTQNRILLPTVTPNGIALLASNNQNIQFEVFWQSKKGGQILGIDFIDNEGWMILIDGTVLHTIDGGINWQPLSEISDDDFVIYNMKFKNSLDGYLVGNNGNIFKTSDGGKNWEKERIDTKDTLRQVFVEKDLTLVTNILGDSIYIQRDGKWLPLNLPNDKGVDDILLKDGYINILIGDALFQKRIEDIK